MYRYEPFLFFLLISSTGFAQWRIAASAQTGKMSVIDKAFSSIPYSSILPGAGLSVRYEDVHSTHELSFSWLGGSLKTNTQPKYSLDQHYFNADYTWLYKIGAHGDAWTGGAGGALQALYDKRTYTGIINNNTSFDFAASLGLAGSLSYSFNNGLPGWSLSDQISIPVVSWLVQPPYGEEGAAASLTGSGNRQQIAGFSSFLRIKNTVSLDRQLSSNGMLSLAYTWDYYRIDALRQVRQADHRLSLTYHLTF
jgi:hypothetical protein